MKKYRLSIINRIESFAQITEDNLVDGASSSVDDETKVKLSPPPAVPSQFLTILQSGYDPSTIQSIMSICNILNGCLYYSSNGSESFYKLYQNNFNSSTSPISESQMHIRGFSNILWKTLLNSGKQFTNKVSSKIIHSMCNSIISNASFNSLPQVSPDSLIAKNVTSNLKNDIYQILNKIKITNPTNQ